MIKIVKGLPPNFKEIKSFFKLPAKNDNIAFAYGETIYSTGIIPEDLIRHEAVHIEQQKKVGGPEIWWRRYFDDPKFRLEQEIPAYRTQYHAWILANNKKYHKMALEQLAKNLSGPIYMWMVDYETAYKLISEDTRMRI
jgi:hypothetical protein